MSKSKRLLYLGRTSTSHFLLCGLCHEFAAANALYGSRVGPVCVSQSALVLLSEHGLVQALRLIQALCGNPTALAEYSAILLDYEQYSMKAQTHSGLKYACFGDWA